MCTQQIFELINSSSYCKSSFIEIPLEHVMFFWALSKFCLADFAESLLFPSQRYSSSRPEGFSCIPRSKEPRAAATKLYHFSSGQLLATQWTVGKSAYNISWPIWIQWCQWRWRGFRHLQRIKSSSSHHTVDQEWPHYFWCDTWEEILFLDKHRNWYKYLHWHNNVFMSSEITNRQPYHQPDKCLFISQSAQQMLKAIQGF